MQTVVMPWRPESSPERKTACRRVTDELIADGFGPLLANANPWSPGAARNRGAELAYGPVLIFNDADTIVPGGQIREAAMLALEAPGLVYAYRLYLRETQDGRPTAELFDPPSMGCVAIQRVCYDQLGGFAEWEGWGYEDCDFAKRAAALWPIHRVEGVATHLWHGDRNADDSPADSDPELVALNLSRWLTV